MVLWEFYKNITGCVGITGYWSETILIVSLQENIVFVKIFETSFDRNILASIAEFDGQGSDIFLFFLSANFWMPHSKHFLHK